MSSVPFRADPRDMVKVFNEDSPVLEAQQRMIQTRLDAAPLAARRMLEAMFARE